MAGLNVDGRVSKRAADESGRAADGVLVGSAGVPLTATPSWGIMQAMQS